MPEKAKNALIPANSLILQVRPIEQRLDAIQLVHDTNAALQIARTPVALFASVNNDVAQLNSIWIQMYMQNHARPVHLDANDCRHS